MSFDPDGYSAEVLPLLARDLESRSDPILRYAIAPPVGTVPDRAYLSGIRSWWAQSMEHPVHGELIKSFVLEASSFAVNDPDFWAEAWEQHEQRVSSQRSRLPPPPEPPEAGDAPTSERAATESPVEETRYATPASVAFAEARMAIDRGGLSEARKHLNGIAISLTEAEAGEAQALRTAIDERRAEFEQHLSEAHDLLQPDGRSPGRGDLERAGELLHRAHAIDDEDDRAPQALRLVPAPTPTDVVARIVDQAVIVSWEPALHRFGTVDYIVLRAPAGQLELTTLTAVTVETTDGRESRDAPDLGREYRYGVLAIREGCRNSPVVEAGGTVVVTAEVGDLRLQYEGGVVRGAWHRPERASRVRVARHAVGGGEIVELVEGVRVDGFEDGSVELDEDYTYTVSCVYLVNGREVSSPGRSVVVSPKDAPDPVEVIEGFVEDDRYVLTWSTPAAGEVVLRRLAQRPKFLVGDRIDSELVTELGEPVSESIQVSSPRSRTIIEVPSGLSWYLPITINGPAAVVGEAIMVDHLRPVDLLEAARQGEDVVVTWLWPEGATDARVDMTYQGHTSYSRTVSKAEVDREGGVHVPAGPEAVQVRVTAVGGAERGRRQSSVASVTVPARMPTIYCEPDRRGSQVVMRLEADRDCRVSRLSVVGQRRRTPSGPHDGEEIAVIEGLDLLAGEVALETIGKVKRGMELACYPGPLDAVSVRAGRPRPHPNGR